MFSPLHISEHKESSANTNNTNTNDDTTIHNLNDDRVLIGAPPDVVTYLAFSPNSRFVSATSWAKQMRVWELKGEKGETNIPRFNFNAFDVPLLCNAWCSNEHPSFGMLDGVVALTNITTCQPQRLYTHASAVSTLHYIPEYQALLSGSWDHTVKLFDARSNRVIKDTFLSDEIYCMDAQQHIFLVGTADKEVSTWDIRKMDKALCGETMKDSLQTRSVALMPDLRGYVQGSINGRCSVYYYYDDTDHHHDKMENNNNKNKSNSYGFRCHIRKIGNVVELHAVNAVKYHPTIPNLLATCGSDGRFSLWDTDSRMHKGSLPFSLNMPITAFQWAPDGKSAVYAAGNDFSKGTTSSFSKIYWHALEEAEAEGKENKKK